VPARPRPPLPPGPYLVVGLARSGEAVARVLAGRGEQVIAVDAAASGTLRERAGRLAAAGVEVHLDASGVPQLENVRTVVKSPGVPNSAPVILSAHERGRTVLGELEVAWRLLDHPFLAVTGTNGKTTTTEWIGHIHRTAGVPAAVAGNVGTALSQLVGTVSEEASVICEASSFQLEDTEAFAPELAVLLNLAPDHLDRHGTFESYVRAKLRIFANQGPDDVAVLPDTLGDRPLPGASRPVRFGESAAAALRLRGGELQWRGTALLPALDVRLPGAHNLQNAMAAAAACLERGLPAPAVAEGLRSFAGVPHRLETVAEIAGVRYVNDSKATNVASALVGLEAFKGGVHMILGGQGKGQDFTPLAPAIAVRCRAVYLIGEDAPLIADALREIPVRIRSCGDLATALDAAAAAAGVGETVLLSPACASFDQFRDFEARGERFRELVQERIDDRPSGGARR
jgi:UDP-N-acetylmuramoylalanine--D-glutamate ligase